MPATRDGKLWRSQFYYKDWQGIRRKKNKRGFKTKGEADEWERNFLQQQQKNLDISFENFVEIYFADMENRLRESTIINKRYVFDLKVTPYFRHKKMCEIQTSDIRAWQNELIKKGYAPTYLKSINNQLAALFNYAVRYYDLRDNSPFVTLILKVFRIFLSLTFLPSSFTNVIFLRVGFHITCQAFCFIFRIKSS